MEENSFVIPDELVISKIYFFRDKKVMLDSPAIGMADLYGLETRRSSYSNWLPVAILKPGSPN